MQGGAAGPVHGALQRAAGRAVHLLRFLLLSPSGVALLLLTGLVVGAWLAPRPLPWLSALVVVVQALTSPEFLLRARLGFRVGFWHNARSGFVFGDAVRAGGA